MTKSEKIARLLLDSWKHRTPYKALSGTLSVGSMAEAYEAQQALQRLHSQDRGAVVGRKIALASKAMQDMVGIDQPIAGAFFANDVYESPATIEVSNFVRLGLEFEVAIELKSTVAPQDTPHTYESARDLIAAVRPAFELIEDRAADYSNLDAHTIVADNAWCGGVVLGDPIDNWQTVELGDIPSVVHQLGVPDEESNTGAADPLGSLVWVLNHFRERGISLSQGEHIITGSAVRTRFPKSGDRLSYDFAGASVQATMI